MPESAALAPNQAEARVRDQRRALHAYACVRDLADTRDYRNAVNDLGANILRSGLCAALAALQRRKDNGARMVLLHLAGAGIPGLDGASDGDLAARVRDLDLDAYLIATREALRVAAWLKRAVQAKSNA